MAEWNLLDALLDSVNRSVHRNAAIKVSSLTKAEIFRLTDEELCNLLDDKFSQLPAAEIDRIMTAEIDNFFAPIQTVLSVLFPPPRSSSTNQELTPPPPPAPSIPTPLLKTLTWGFVAFFGLTMMHIPILLFQITWAAYQSRRQQQLARSTLPPKPRYARIAILPKLQGLKVVGEPYIRDTSRMVLRQDLPTEGNRAASERQI